MQRAGTLTREARASGSASSTRMNLLGMLAGSLAGVSSAKEISGGARKPIGMANVGWSESITGCSMEGELSGWLSKAGGPLAGRRWRGDPRAGTEWWNSLVDLGRKEDTEDGTHRKS